MEVWFGAVSIAMPQTIALNLVEVVEVGAPAGVAPVLWRLLTTAPVASLDEALGIVRLYQQRWRIEEYNRTCKKSGIDLEGAMIEGVHA